MPAALAPLRVQDQLGQSIRAALSVGAPLFRVFLAPQLPLLGGQRPGDMAAGNRVELRVEHVHARVAVLEQAGAPPLAAPVVDRLPAVARQLVLLALDGAGQFVVGLRPGRLHQPSLVDRPLRRSPRYQTGMPNRDLACRQSPRRGGQTGQPLSGFHIMVGLEGDDRKTSRAARLAPAASQRRANSPRTSALYAANPDSARPTAPSSRRNPSSDSADTSAAATQTAAPQPRGRGLGRCLGWDHRR